MASGAASHGDAPTGFTPVPLSILMCGTQLPFRLFQRKGSAYVLYRDTDSVFEMEQRVELSRDGVEQLHVCDGDWSTFHTYIQTHILRLMDGDSSDDTARSDAVYYEAARVTTRMLLEEPSSEEAARAAQQLVEASLDRMAEESSLLVYFGRLLTPAPDLYAHSLQTCLYGLALARRSGIDNRAELRDLGLGLLLHDVGKRHLPMEDFAHEGPLSEDEWEQMRRHPRLGLDLVGDNPLVGTVARQVILQHHECADGSGYPDGLSGEQISRYAHIAAVANTFDRHTTELPYRPAATALVALRRMITDESTRHHPRYLAAFIRLMAQ